MALEYKSISLELKDLDTEHRTAILAHATYDNVDLGKDLIRKGAFTKSWKENKEDIGYYLNHDDEKTPGKVTDVFEDNQHAYTKVWNGTHTLGNDTLKMMDEGVIKRVSFGFAATRSNKIEVKGAKVREIKELYHGETSVLTKLQMNPGSKVVKVTKAMHEVPRVTTEFKMLSQPEQDFLTQIISTGNASLMSAISLANGLDIDSDLYTYINYFISRTADQLSDLKGQLKWGRKSYDGIKSHLQDMEKFVRNTTASDECIKLISDEIFEIKNILSNDTADTRLIDAPAASIDKDYADNLLTNLLSIKQKL